MYSLKSGRLNKDLLSIIATEAIAIKAYIITQPIKSQAKPISAAIAKTNKLNQKRISPK